MANDWKKKTEKKRFVENWKKKRSTEDWHKNEKWKTKKFNRRKSWRILKEEQKNKIKIAIRGRKQKDDWTKK